MNDHDLWDLERRFWLGGAEVYERWMDPACLMAFPAPAGLMQGPAIIEALKAAPRWAGVDMHDRRLARPADGLAVLGYRASARREGQPPYSALCTSAYRRDADAWRLIQHQQTPA